MKVVIVHNRYRSSSPSGEDRVVDQEAAALEAAGHTVKLFERFSDDIEQMSVVRKAIIPGQVLWSHRAGRDLVQVLRSFRPDVVHCHNTFPLVSPSVLYACRQERVPAVVTLHNYRQLCPSGDLFRDGKVCHDCLGGLPIPAIRNGCYRDSMLATVPLALATVGHAKTWRTLPAAYVFISAAERDNFATLQLPPERCFVKHNLVPPIHQVAAVAEPKVVFIGRLTAAKGVRNLMQAWNTYTSRGRPGLGLSIAGAGELEDELGTWAAARPAVDMLGHLTRQQCAALLASARAVIVPSEWEETFGLVVVEAMASGVPAVASAHGAFPELINDGVDGVLFPPGDASALAAVLQEIDQDPARFEKLGRAARRSYEQRFDSADNLAQLESIYRFAIEHPVWGDRDEAPLATGAPSRPRDASP